MPGKAIIATGSITLVHAPIAAGLVDEYRLFVYPVVSGAGRRLFAPGTARPRLRLLGARSLEGGVILPTYRAGESRTGS